MPHTPALTLTTIFCLFCTLWLLTPHVAVSVAQLYDERYPYGQSANATLARLRARKQLEIHRAWMLLDGVEMLMLEGMRGEANQTRVLKWNQRLFDRVAVPGWLRRMRVWLMVD